MQEIRELRTTTKDVLKCHLLENAKQCPGAMVKHIKIEYLSRNVYIQHFGNIKSYFPNIKSLFYFLFWYA
jgi:hypothetical protein